MRVVRENTTLSIVNIAGSCCTAGTSALRAFDDRCAIDVIATHRCRSQPRCADSESQFLAMKKFSWQPASRLIVTRQNRFFARIAAADSRCDFSRAAASRLAMNDRCAPACASATPRRCRRRRVRSSDAELGLEQVVDRLRIGLAAGRLHHLSDEPADQLRLGAGLRDLVGIG